jgi:chromosome segregation ATPase
MSLLSTRKDRQTQQMAPLPPTPRRKVSEDAAHFAQNILDLEERCQRLAGEASSWESQCNIMGVEIKSLREALQQTDARLQYFERRTTQLETKLETAAKIVIDCLNEASAPDRKNGHGQERGHGQEHGNGQAQQNGGDDSKLPRGLAAGPRAEPATG